jgi:hypothetical protein
MSAYAQHGRRSETLRISVAMTGDQHRGNFAFPDVDLQNQQRVRALESGMAGNAGNKKAERPLQATTARSSTALSPEFPLAAEEG